MPRNPDDQYSPEETARRADAVVRRMVKTPPQPNGKPKPRRRGKKKPTAVCRALRKSGAAGKAP